MWSIRLWNWAARKQGDPERALRYADEILALGGEIGEGTAEAFAQWEKGITLLSAASPLQAGEQFRQALLGFERAAFINNSSAALEYLAYVAADLGQPERAVRMFGAAMRHKQNYPDYVLFFERTQQEHYHALIKSALGADAFAAAYAEGEAMTLEQAVKYALEED